MKRRSMHRGWRASVLALAALLPMVGASDGPFQFRNAQAGSGVDFVLENSATANKHQIETMIAGVALLDYDGDGWLDIYCVNGAPIPSLRKDGPRYWNRLYRNLQDGRFEDVTEKAGVAGDGYGMGVAVGDYDNDGNPDIYVAGVNQNQLFHNNGDGTFRDATEEAGVAALLDGKEKPFAVSAGWFDYNNDGHLDLMVVNYIQWSLASEPECLSQGMRAYCPPDRYPGMPNQLFRNNGDGTFADVSAASSIAKHVGKGMGIAFADYDGDGYTDVFVANDTHRNFFFRNSGDGTFEEMALLLGVAYNEHGKAVAGMGVDFRDIDNDGRPDLFETALFRDTFPFFRNDGDQFEDITSASGLAGFTTNLTGWSNGIFDFDNDGWKDLFTANASVLDNSDILDHLPYRIPVRFYRNLSDGRFAVAPMPESVARAAVNRGAAFGDLNNDGRVDVVVTGLGEKTQVLMNESTPEAHWLQLRLAGRTSNRDGLGARIAVTLPDGSRRFNHASTSVGYGCSSDRRVHFGLGRHAVATTVEVIWPSGKRQTLRDVRGGRIVEVTEP